MSKKCKNTVKFYKRLLKTLKSKMFGKVQKRQNENVKHFLKKQEKITTITKRCFVIGCAL